MALRHAPTTHNIIPKTILAPKCGDYRPIPTDAAKAHLVSHTPIPAQKIGEIRVAKATETMKNRVLVKC